MSGHLDLGAGEKPARDDGLDYLVVYGEDAGGVHGGHGELGSGEAKRSGEEVGGEVLA